MARSTLKALAREALFRHKKRRGLSATQTAHIIFGLPRLGPKSSTRQITKFLCGRIFQRATTMIGSKRSLGSTQEGISNDDNERSALLNDGRENSVTTSTVNHGGDTSPSNQRRFGYVDISIVLPLAVIVAPTTFSNQGFLAERAYFERSLQDQRAYFQRKTTRATSIIIS